MSDSVIFELIVSFESPNEESACFIAQEVDRLVNAESTGGTATGLFVRRRESIPWKMARREARHGG